MCFVTFIQCPKTFSSSRYCAPGKTPASSLGEHQLYLRVREDRGDLATFPYLHVLVPRSTKVTARIRPRAIPDLMPINAFCLENLRKRTNRHREQSASPVAPKSFPSFAFIWLLAFLVGTQGAAKSIIVDDDDTRIQYSSIGWDRSFAIKEGKVLDGTLHVYGYSLIARDSMLIPMA